MDLRQIQLVRAVVRAGSVTRAAEQELIAQPAVSKRIRSLEGELGIALFHRVGRRVVPTEAGLALADCADRIDEDLAAGRPLWSAIVESAVRRMRPIVLTALAAILAMVPLTHSVFWGPMAWAIMGGLSAATLLTLLFLPALYASWYGATKPVVAAAGD